MDAAGIAGATAGFSFDAETKSFGAAKQASQKKIVKKVFLHFSFWWNSMPRDSRTLHPIILFCTQKRTTAVSAPPTPSTTSPYQRLVRSERNVKNTTLQGFFFRSPDLHLFQRSRRQQVLRGGVQLHGRREDLVIVIGRNCFFRTCTSTFSLSGYSKRAGLR